MAASAAPARRPPLPAARGDSGIGREAWNGQIQLSDTDLQNHEKKQTNKQNKKSQSPFPGVQERFMLRRD
jgi:hypothetical protein